MNERTDLPFAFPERTSGGNSLFCLDSVTVQGNRLDSLSRHAQKKANRHSPADSHWPDEMPCLNRSSKGSPADIASHRVDGSRLPVDSDSQLRSIFPPATTHLATCWRERDRGRGTCGRQSPVHAWDRHTWDRHTWSRGTGASFFRDRRDDRSDAPVCRNSDPGSRYSRCLQHPRRSDSLGGPTGRSHWPIKLQARRSDREDQPRGLPGGSRATGTLSIRFSVPHPQTPKFDRRG